VGNRSRADASSAGRQDLRQPHPTLLLGGLAPAAHETPHQGRLCLAPYPVDWPSTDVSLVWPLRRLRQPSVVSSRLPAPSKIIGFPRSPITRRRQPDSGPGHGRVSTTAGAVALLAHRRRPRRSARAAVKRLAPAERPSSFVEGDAPPNTALVGRRFETGGCAGRTSMTRPSRFVLRREGR
jgi:hypothetical protein